MLNRCFKKNLVPATRREELLLSLNSCCIQKLNMVVFGIFTFSEETVEVLRLTEETVSIGTPPPCRKVKGRCPFCSCEIVRAD